MPSSKPSTIMCKLCGKSIEWVKLNDTGSGFSWRPFEAGTSIIHRNCGAKVKVYSKQEIAAFAKERGL